MSTATVPVLSRRQLRVEETWVKHPLWLSSVVRSASNLTVGEIHRISLALCVFSCIPLPGKSQGNDDVWFHPLYF